MFTLNATHLEHLVALNEFPVPKDRMVFLGFRGCLPVNPGDPAFRREQALTAANVDYLHPRCTLVQWLPEDGTFAVYPGSTVPHRGSVQAAKARGGAGANQLLPGYYADFRKGVHKAGKPTGHAAFRQTQSRPYRRTADDLDYDPLDRVEIGNPGDNLHAAWCGGVDAPSFASAGCQVVVGYPKCPQRGAQENTGPWKAFHHAAYSRAAQESFGYVLVGGSEVQRLALAGPAGMERVRFGSKGARAKRVQTALKDRGHYEGHVDGDFGARSLRALLEFQEAAFGPAADDGICGPQTAQALALDWP